ncbi:unnamed protein product [Rhizophagus irregularis]|nr:unnamed protein product [Rhizophagus irregularis]
MRSRSRSRNRSSSNSRNNTLNKDNTTNSLSNPSSSHNGNNNNNTQSRPYSQNAKGKDRSVSFSSASRSSNTHSSTVTISPAAYKEDLNIIMTALQQLQIEVATVRKRITALELADQRMTCIESHLGLNPLPTNTSVSEPDLMQEDPPIIHVPLQLHSCPPSSGLSQPILKVHGPPVTPSLTVTPLPSSISTDTNDTSSVQNEELKAVMQNHSKIENTMRILLSSVQKLAASLGGTSSVEADSASSV